MFDSMLQFAVGNQLYMANAVETQCRLKKLNNVLAMNQPPPNPRKIKESRDE